MKGLWLTEQCISSMQSAPGCKFKYHLPSVQFIAMSVGYKHCSMCSTQTFRPRRYMLNRFCGLIVVIHYTLSISTSNFVFRIQQSARWYFWTLSSNWMFPTVQNTGTCAHSASVKNNICSVFCCFFFHPKLNILGKKWIGKHLTISLHFTTPSTITAFRNNP